MEKKIIEIEIKTRRDTGKNQRQGVENQKQLNWHPWKFLYWMSSEIYLDNMFQSSHHNHKSSLFSEYIK